MGDAGPVGAGHLVAGEAQGQPGGQQHAGVVHDLDVQVGLGRFQAAYERWVRQPGHDLPALVDESLAGLAG